MEKRGQYRRNSFGTLWFLVNLVFGIYLLNWGLKFIDISKFITDPINNIIITIGGALIIVSGVVSLRRTTPYMPRYR